MITIIPAIDMIGGECVRLTQGDYDRKTSYYKDPLEVALRYADCGIRRLQDVYKRQAQRWSPPGTSPRANSK